MYAAINILKSGAKGDCITDDSTVINNVIRSIENSNTHAGEIYFPAPPGGCYLVNKTLTLPGPKTFTYDIVISLVGEGRGVTVVKAGSPMEAVLDKDTNYNTGDTVTDMTFDANGLAKHAIAIRGGSELRFTRIEGLNGTADDLYLDGPATFDGENFFSDSMFSNTITFPPYNIYVGRSTDNEFTNNVLRNAQTANVYEAGGSNHFLSNHAYGYPQNLCPQYSFITTYTSIWIGNQSDCSNEAAFLIDNWQTLVQSNLIQGATDHAVCISPKVGDAQVMGNSMIFTNPNASPDNAIVQGIMENGQVSCAGNAVHTATWSNGLNFGATNQVLNNFPTSNENLWTAMFTANLGQLPAVGVGTTAPQATLDINGYARLTTNASAPAECRASNKGAIALTSASHLCICDGTSWKFDSSGQSCLW